MKKNRIWKIVTVAAACIACFCFESLALPKDVLTQVQVRQSSADLTEGMTASVAWQQNEKGAASVLICDLDGRIVRQLVENAPMGSGAHQIQWDGRDINGKPCPVGAYLPIIKVKTETGRVGVHNPTASDWGAELPLQQPDYDIDRQEITFSLAKAALCLLRIGKAEGGPCYGTLLNWEPRPSGEVKLAWDGMDAQRVLNVGRRANLAFRLITITLPQNAILITGAPVRSLPKETRYRRYPLHAPHGQNVFLHAYHSRDLCHDFTISAKMKKASRKWWGGKVARGTIEIAVDKKKDPQHIHLQREQFEIYLYVDDTFIREEKRSNVPASIALDTTALSNGEHIVNVGLRTLEDHLGTYTMKINVDN